MTSIKYMYIIQKTYVKDFNVLHDRMPICGSEDHEIIIDRAERQRDYILKHGDPWFDDADSKQKSLIAWDGSGYYAVGTSDRRLRIIFAISIMPVFTNDISE